MLSAHEKLEQYKAGKELLAVLAASVRPQDVANRVAALAARIADEARSTPAGTNGTVTASGDVFATATVVLEGISMTNPWGKHDIGFGAEHLMLRNNRGVVSIPYAGIEHVVILEQIPKESKDKNCVVLALKRDSDVRSGKARLDVVVAQTRATPAVTVAVPPSCEGLEGPSLTGPAAVVLCQLLGSHIPDIQEDTFVSTDPAIFRSSSGHLAVSANVRTATGWLFPLQGALLFLGKPAHFLRHSELAGWEWVRTGGAAAGTFDVNLHLAGGKGRVELGQIGREDLPALQAYVAERRLPVGFPDPDAAPRQAASSGKRGAAAAASSGEAGRAVFGGAGGGGDDDDSEEDSDFDPEAADGAGEPSSKRQRTEEDGEDLVSDDSGDEDGEGDSDDDDDEGSDEMSLVNTDELSGDEGGGGGDSD